MNTEQNQKVLLEQLEALKKENEQLKKELSILRNENISNRPVSFKEKYAVRILDSLPDMLTVFNQNEVGIEVVSNEETNHVGISNKDFKGMYMREMVPSEAYQNIHSNMRQAVSTGAVSTAHHELDFNGEHHHYENRIFPLDEEYVLIMCRDITERVTTQRQLEVFKSVLDKVSDSILAVSEDGTLVYANKQFIEEYGVTQQMGIQKIYDLPVSMTTKEAWERRLQEIRDNDGTFAYRAAYMRKGEDKERMHQVSTFLIRENNEELTWFFTQDITDVIKKQDELRELNLLLDGILNNIPVYLFVKDPGNEFRYLYWNRAFEEYSRIPASRALGHTDYEIFPSPKDAEHFRQDDLTLLRTGERQTFIEEYVSATGETRIVNTSKSLVPVENRLPLIIGVSWDITDMKNAELEIVEARIRAEESDRLKSAFLANMSHEIRTPLNAIVGFAKLIGEVETEEEKQQFIDIIDVNSELLLQLINDILDISKIEAGTLEFRFRPMNLNDLCRSELEVHKPRVKPGVELVFEERVANVEIVCDQNRLAQVISNLLNNAGKFTEEGEIRFGFDLKDGCVEFFVQDTGMGIPPEKARNIFDRFVKLNDFAAGTGLGLAISKMIVEKLDGTIGVDSEPGKGTRFHFSIPVVHRDGSKNDEQFCAAPGRDDGKSWVLLVAEDSDTNFRLIEAVLSRRFSLVRAHTGAEAVDMFGTVQPDAVLMDIRMPVMDGLEATRRIRSVSADVPIIAMSAYSSGSEIESARNAGCNEFLVKPLSQYSLHRALNAALVEFKGKGKS